MRRGVFDAATKEQLQTWLRQGPGEAARALVTVGASSPTPSRWSLRTICAEVAWLRDYTLSGVWGLLQRYGLGLHSVRVQQFSADLASTPKEARLLEVPAPAASRPTKVAVLFLDEIGFYR